MTKRPQKQKAKVSASKIEDGKSTAEKLPQIADFKDVEKLLFKKENEIDPGVFFVETHKMSRGMSAMMRMLPV
jgi:hypothetical protein